MSRYKVLWHPQDPAVFAVATPELFEIRRVIEDAEEVCYHFVDTWHVHLTVVFRYYMLTRLEMCHLGFRGQTFPLPTCWP
jgi:hypothetical protein